MIDFFFTNCFCSNLLGPIESNSRLAQKRQKSFGPYELFSDFCRVRYYEKKRATLFFSLERLPFVQKFVFSTTS